MIWSLGTNPRLCADAVAVCALSPPRPHAAALLLASGLQVVCQEQRLPYLQDQ